MDWPDAEKTYTIEFVRRDEFRKALNEIIGVVDVGHLDMLFCFTDEDVFNKAVSLCREKGWRIELGEG